MKMTIRISLFILLGLLTNQVLAGVAYNYFGLNYQKLFVSSPGISGGSPDALNLSIGQHLDPSLAVEASFTLPSTTVNASWNGNAITQKVDNMLNARLRKTVLSANGFEGYATLGLSLISLKYTESQTNISQTDKTTLDLNYGVGTRFRLGNQSRMTGNIEYTQLIATSDVTLSTLTLGIHYYF